MILKVLNKPFLAIMAFYFFVYVFYTSINNDLMGNILSPIGSLLAAIILFRTWKQANNRSSFWILTGFACFFWSITDILWAFWQYGLGIDPEAVDIFMYLYLLPNIFLAIAVSSSFFPQIKKWNRFQLMLDIVTTLIVVISGVWILFLHREFNLLLQLDAIGLSTFLYILADLFAITILFLQFASNHEKIKDIPSRLHFWGILIFTATDLIYCWQVFHDAYIPNSIIDAVYLGALLLVALGGLRQSSEGQETKGNSDIRIPQNYGSSSRILLLLIIPIIIILLNGFVLEEILFLLGVIAIHQALSGIVQNSMWNAYQLQREKDINEELEVRIAQHTQELIKANRELDYLACVDVVTGLNNRWFSMKELEGMLGRDGKQQPTALFYMDLDRFKAINDSYGHQTGDAVLVALARRMKLWKAPEMLLARIGGDEFVVALPYDGSRNRLKEIADDLVMCCSYPVSLPPFRFFLGVSIGIALYPQDAEDLPSLLKYADIAMYQAKAQSDSRYAFYSSELNEQVMRRHKIEILLKRADFDQEFTLHFQPQIRITDRALVGMEALLRWNAPGIGPVSPGEFISIAEETGSILPISEWVISKAVAQITHWNYLFGKNLKMGINISPKHISSAHFLSQLQKQIETNKTKTEWLDLEITESSAMANEVFMEETLKALGDMGISISIDDFGTGYSSISYLKRFHIDRLKIAKPLIDHIATNSSDSQIVAAIVTMAKSMSIRTIAEGVETSEQLEVLQQKGCEEIQGYFYGRPVPAQEFEDKWLIG